MLTRAKISVNIIV